MAARRWQGAGVLSAVFGLLACSLIVDTSEIDAGCGAGKKFCGEKCVSVDEPFYGCTLDECTPCDELAEHTVVQCVAGGCQRIGCQYGWGCEGCSASLFTEAANCGRCDNACDEAAGETCRDGVCSGPGATGGAGGVGGTSIDEGPGGASGR